MGFFQKLKEKVKQLKSEIQVLSIAYLDPRTPWAAKLLIGITVGYLLSPIDLIPDFIPVLGILDDLILVPLLITASIKLIPEIVITDARSTALKNPKRMKKNNYIVAFFILLIWLILIYSLYSYFKGRTSYF
ncbi:YkvA family protein [Gillisia sp. CAL575]|uniref:YkvA family protein n=1 Tax=Gillisia sp. CAL575 TaxID=985255 RepID=UPI0003A8EF71|nr:YkvA family protein [Gillisia sp. CAL575]